MTFCYSPWTGIDINTQGDIKPCCKFSLSEHNINNNNISDYLNSKLLQSVKNSFLNGQWPLGCNQCKTDENLGIPSKRQLDFTRWKPYYEKYNISQDTSQLTIAIALGNVCNFKCIMCGPYNSSRWIKEHREIYRSNYSRVDILETENKFYELFNNNKKLVHLDTFGGEPFISGVNLQKKILQQLISSGRSQDITLHYTTNASIFPDSGWQDLWKYFKEVDLQISIDGMGKRFEYIRYPGNWDDISNNIKKYVMLNNQNTNITLSVSHVVSAYNILYLEEIFEWCIKNNLPKPYVSQVYGVDWLSPGVWPAKVKEIIRQKLLNSKIADIKKYAGYLDNDLTNNYKTFIENTKRHDKYRNINFLDAFPELESFINT